MREYSPPLQRLSVPVKKVDSPYMKRYEHLNNSSKYVEGIVEIQRSPRNYLNKYSRYNKFEKRPSNEQKSIVEKRKQKIE